MAVESPEGFLLSLASSVGVVSNLTAILLSVSVSMTCRGTGRGMAQEARRGGA